MRANNLKGFFDVRIYAEGKTREQQKLKSDDETVYFLARFKSGEVPAGLEQFATNYTAKDGTEHARVKFKVGTRAAWYGVNGKKMDRPTNADLEADRYECNIDFVAIEPDPNNPKKACGLWVNAIQAARMERYEFAPMTGYTMPFTDDDPAQGVPQDTTKADPATDDPFA